MNEAASRHALVRYGQRFGTHAEDAVQDAYVQFLTAAGPIRNPSSWMMTAVRYAAWHRLRSDQRRRHYEAQAELTTVPRSVAEPRMMLQRVLTVLETIPNGDVLLAEVMGVDLPMSSAARRNRILRARAALRAACPEVLANL